MARTTAFSYLKYGWETAFRGGSSSYDKIFGRGLRVTSINQRHNPERLMELGQRQPSTVYFKQFEGSLSAEWIFASPWFLKALMGSVNTSGSSAPYTHTYSKTNALPSIALELGFQGELGNVAKLLKGSIISSCSITGAINDAIKVRADILFSDVTETTLSSAIVDSFEPFIFHQATLEMPSGNVLAEVQNFELTINNNAVGIYGLGDYRIVSIPVQAFEVTGKMNITMKDDTYIDKLRDYYNTLIFKLSNGLTGANEVSVTINCSNVYLGEHSVSFEPNAIVYEDVPLQIKDITSIVAKNGVSTHP